MREQRWNSGSRPLLFRISIAPLFRSVRLLPFYECRRSAATTAPSFAVRQLVFCGNRNLIRALLRNGLACANKACNLGALTRIEELRKLFQEIYNVPISAFGFCLALLILLLLDLAQFFQRSEEHTSELQSQSNLVCR